MPRVLLEKQQAEYRRDGVLFPVAALNPAETDRFRGEFVKLAEWLGGRPPVHQVQHLHLFHPWALELASRPRILDAVEDLIGPNILIHSSTVFCKYPMDHSYVSWHQDGYYLGLDRFDYTTSWIALSDSSPDNGCMRVVRGSHQGGMQAHTEAAAGPHNMLASGMETAVQVTEEQATEVVLQPGELSLHHIAIVHGSNPNLSSRWRLGVAIRYVAPGVRQAIDHQPAVLVRGEDRHGHFRLLLNPPEAGAKVEMVEAVRAQAELMTWILASRRSKERVEFPGTAGLRWKEPGC